MKTTRILGCVAALATAAVIATATPAAAASAPSAPRSPTATAANASVVVRWSAPATNGGRAIDRYAVQRYYGGGWHTVRTTTASARAWTSTGLTNGTQYGFRVRAHNRVGWGAASATVRATPRTTPAAPRFVSFTRADSAANVTWQAPTSSGGAPVTSYYVERSQDGATFGSGVSTTQLQVGLTGLTPGTRYWFRVRAHNAAGYGAATGVGPFDSTTLPKAPLQIGIDNRYPPQRGEMFLNWGIDPLLGAPISRFWVEHTVPGIVGYVFWGYTQMAEVKLADLTVGEEYSVRVRACNDLGCGPYETSGTLIPVPEPPTAPQSVTPVQTQAGVGVAWVAPADDGGAPIDLYEVELSINSVVQQNQVTDTMQLGFTGLSSNQMYQVRVRAHSTGGSWGPWSAYVPYYNP